MNHNIQTAMTISEFAHLLLDSGVVSGIASLARLPDNGSMAYTLVDNSGAVDSLDPLFPAMPNNAARALSQITRESISSRPLAAFLKPCEFRALVELGKLKQVHFENLIIISFDCGGVYPWERIINEEYSIDEYRNALEVGEIAQGIRPVCMACDAFTPEGADIYISLVGRKGDKLTISFDEDRVGDLANKLGLSNRTELAPAPEIADMLDKRKANRANMEKNIKEKTSTFAGFMELFDRCISCRACRYVCPICYCKNCFFESETFDYYPDSIDARLENRRTLRLPTDRLMFHLGRMAHISASCVACGMCEDACPVNIPVSQVFSTVGKGVQSLFDYIPGMDINDPLALSTYKREELEEMED